MRRISSPKILLYIVYVLFLARPAAGWLLFSWWGAAAGLVASLIIDYFCPIWWIDLKESDLDRIINYMACQGRGGQRLYLNINKRRIIIQLYECPSGHKLGFSISTDDWPEIIQKLKYDPNLTDWIDYNFQSSIGLHPYYTYVPKISEVGVKGLLNIALQHAGATINNNVRASIYGINIRYWYVSNHNKGGNRADPEASRSTERES